MNKSLNRVPETTKFNVQPLCLEDKKFNNQKKGLSIKGVGI